MLRVTGITVGLSSINLKYLLACSCTQALQKTLWSFEVLPVENKYCSSWWQFVLVLNCPSRLFPGWPSVSVRTSLAAQQRISTRVSCGQTLVLILTDPRISVSWPQVPPGSLAHVFHYHQHQCIGLPMLALGPVGTSVLVKYSYPLPCTWGDVKIRSRKKNVESMKWGNKKQKNNSWPISFVLLPQTAKIQKKKNPQGVASVHTISITLCVSYRRNLVLCCCWGQEKIKKVLEEIGCWKDWWSIVH